MSEKNPTPVENDKGESASVPTPEPLAVAGPAPEPAEAARNSRHDSEVTLAVVSPFWTTHFNCEGEDGGTLSIDRTGTVVSRSDLKAVFDAAAKSGVALTEVSD